MKIPMFNMSVIEQLSSRAMLVGWCLLAFGIFLAITGVYKAAEMNIDVIKEGGTYIAAGIATFGFRDKKK